MLPGVDLHAVIVVDLTHFTKVGIRCLFPDARTESSRQAGTSAIRAGFTCMCVCTSHFVTAKKQKWQGLGTIELQCYIVIVGGYHLLVLNATRSRQSALLILSWARRRSGNV